MPSLDNSDPSDNSVEAVQHWVEICQDWASQDWEVVPYLECIEQTTCTNPQCPRAEFVYWCGQIKREDQNSIGSFTPNDIRNYYIRVWEQYPEDDPSVVFTGYVTQNEMTYYRQDYASGPESITAFGIEHLLDSFEITESYIGDIAGSDNQDPNNNQGDENQDEDKDFQAPSVEHVFPFNEHPKTGYQLQGNRSDVEGPDGVFVFSDDGNTWSASDVILYLLEYFSPLDMQFNLVGQTDVLDDITEYWHFESRHKPMTCWQAIKHILNHEHGLGFTLTPDPDSGEININVFTITQFPVSFGDKTLPANQNQTDFTLPTGQPFAHLCDNVPFLLTTANQYDQLVIRGSEIKAVLPLGYQGVPLIKGWSSTVQSNYDTAVGGGDIAANDQFREGDPANTFHDVYLKYIIDPAWDGTITGVNVLPIPQPDGSVSFDTDDGDPIFWPLDAKLEHNTPFLKEVDYTQDPPVDKRLDKTKEEYMELIGFYNDTSNGTVHEADSNWHWVERLNTPNQTALKNLHIQPLTGQLGVKLHVTPNHYCGLGTFNPPSGSESSIGPELNVLSNLTIVGMFRTYRRPEVIVNLRQTDKQPRRHFINVEAARYVYAAYQCPIAIDNGQIKQLAGSGTKNIPIPLPGGGKEDTTSLLKKVAAQAQAWFGVERQSVAIKLRQPGYYLDLGAIVTSLNMAATSFPVGTLVTSKTTNYRDQTTTIHTSYLELDYGTLAGRKEDARGYGEDE